MNKSVGQKQNGGEMPKPFGDRQTCEQLDKNLPTQLKIYRPSGASFKNGPKNKDIHPFENPTTI
jgi:hypothetical protein